MQQRTWGGGGSTGGGWSAGGKWPAALGALAGLVLLLVLAGRTATAKDIPEKEPSPKRAGKLGQWTSKKGIVYRYRLPKGYDAKVGANLTFILHGSNLDHRWGFANHAVKSFRPHDIVVSPDGTTANGRGGFNSLGRSADAKRFHEFHEELRALLTIKATYLYGHSQGSFFAFFYAGEFPKDVQGVVGHASGVWTQTRLGKKGHHQAIVLMHGTQDPVVPYMQSAGGFSSYTDSKYPLVRLRSLEWWNHWPAEHNGPVPHTSQQLAWVEGMTTVEASRLEACWDILGAVKNTEQHDYVATYTFAKRLAASNLASAKCKKKAAKAVTAIEILIREHIETMALSDDVSLAGAGKKAPGKNAPDEVAAFVYFMRRFDGIEACDAYVEGFAKVLRTHQKAAVKHLKKYFPAMREGDKAEAFEQGVLALAEGYLWPECHDQTLRKNLKTWRKEAKKLKVPKRILKLYDEVVAPFDKALTSGWKSFGKRNAKHGKL